MSFLLALYLTIFSGLVNDHQADNFIVVIDAAHGGNDHGGKNISLDLIEKKLSLKVSQMLEDQFDLAYKIVLTRSDDKSMSNQQRIDFINQLKPHLYLSIHFGHEMNEDEFGMYALFTKTSQYTEDAEYYASFFLEEFIDMDEMLPVRQPTAGSDEILNGINCPGVMLTLGSFDVTDYNQFLTQDKNVAEISYLIAAAIRGIKNDY